jgi:hypothetical protein
MGDVEPPSICVLTPALSAWRSRQYTGGGSIFCMTWKFFEIRAGDTKAQVLLDHRFAGSLPTAALPTIAWFGVWCNEAPQGAYWSPTEAPVLDAIEADLIHLVETHGHGWAVYVRRYATPGLREYYFYCGAGADMHAVAVGIAAMHLTYRIEFDTRPDPTWSGYASWLRDAPLG